MHLQHLTQESWQLLLDRQCERESLALAEGAQHFRQQVAKEAERGTLARSDVAKKLLQQGIEPLELAIREWLTFIEQRGKEKPVAYKWIKLVEVPVAAYMTLKVVLDGITKQREYTTICCEVSDLILRELRYRRLRAKAPGLFQYKLKQFRTSSYAHMARSMDHAVRTAKDDEDQLLDVSDLQLTPHQRVHVGAKLIELLVASTGLVVPQNGPRKRKDRKPKLYLEATEETSAWLSKRTDVLAILQPQNTPMIVPPLQWAPGKRGGFRYAQRGMNPLIRGVFDKQYRATLEHAEMPLLYEALNSLQNTAWRINRAVYDLVRAVEQRGGGIAGVPRTEPLPIPARPVDMDTNEVARKVWRNRAGSLKDQNHLQKLRAREVQRVLDTAADVIDEEAIFFPYSVDFRGRIYPISDYLHPQGNDLAKSLLMFSQGKAIDENGARWLAIHGANCIGEVPEGKMSKMTLDERVQWVHTNTNAILALADDPFADMWWIAADEPLQFYAFCIEWRNLIRANGKGEDYICSLPVSMDGTCNGLQHLSAMLHDEMGGAAVNVLPQSRPQDIYHAIAETILPKLEALAASDDLAALWLGLHSRFHIVDRKLTKRPTMTFGYGSKRYGFASQLREELRGRDNWHEIKEHFGTKLNKKGKEVSRVGEACRLMSTLIWHALEEVVVSAFEGMQWLQKSARGIVTTGHAVEWTVPVTGFRVRQEYIEWRSQKISTVLAGKIIRPRINLATDKLDMRKQANAISPNVVHSLDAAALMLTVSQAAAEGVEAFAMVHDSYGTLPADCSVLARCCRQSFVRLYTMQDVVWSLYQQFAAQHADPTECPEPPAKGSLDVNGVLASDYFFA